MKVGVDVFTLEQLKLNPFEQLDLISAMGLEGAQFGSLRSLSEARDPGALQAVRQYADNLGLYSHVSLSIISNPVLAGISPEEHYEIASREIALAAACGWHELHGYLGEGNERYEHPLPWTEHLAASSRFIASLGPVLREQGSRINLENHGDLTTAELVRLIEEVGPDIAGVCLDTANLLCHCEDPVMAVRRIAPYTHLTHIKDGAVFFTERGYRRQTLPPGSGIIDWPVIIPMLAAYAPDLPLSIEDHKWLFDYDCFAPRWLSLHPDLELTEFAAFMQLIWQCQQRLASGRLGDPDASEKIPFLDELRQRLASGSGYLKDLLAGLPSA